MSALLDRLGAWYQSREEREQRVLRWGGAAAVLIVVLGSLWQLHAAVQRVADRVERKRMDLAFAQAASAEILAAGPLRAAAPGAGADAPLVVLVDGAAREAGLAAQLGASEAVPPNGMRVRFNAASFDALVAMTARLAQQHGVGVAAASVERGAEPGKVNATLTLQSGGR